MSSSKKHGAPFILSGIGIVLLATPQRDVRACDPPGSNGVGIREPSLTVTTGTDVRIPNTNQADGGQLANLVGSVLSVDAEGAPSLLGHVISQVSSPNDDLGNTLQSLEAAALAGSQSGMQSAADEIMAILTGTTQGRIYDGFAMLNYNRGAFAPNHVPGEYKMKTLTDSGLTAPGMLGQPRRIWEVTVNYLWYGGQFDCDTFLLKVPVEAHAYDTLRVHYRVYSLVTEDFAPTTVLLDNRLPGSVQFPFKGFYSVWERVPNDSVTEITVDHPPLGLLRGIYTWGWRVHPPRIHFLQPVFEMVNAHTGQVQLEPQGESFAFRNRQLTIDDIGDAAPEKKMYQVALAVQNGATAGEILNMMNDPAAAPIGTSQQWTDLLADQDQLPPEAWDVLAAEGIPQGSFGSYRFVTVYMNNEMYGEGPQGNRIEGWHQGDRFTVKLINLDNHTHYFRNVDFGPKLHDDIVSGGFSSGSHSFEIMNFKPTYGAPKVAEMQWRAGWGFRPHFDVIHQDDLFPRTSDIAMVSAFFDGRGSPHPGWQYSAQARQGDFRFNPPNFIIGSQEEPSPNRLREGDGTEGLLIGQLTEGYGVAKMCEHATHPLGGFCETDISAFNPHGVYNIDTDGDGEPDVLWFPPFIRNPNLAAGGDIIPPTAAWKPFLWINPNNGTLFIDPANPSLGYWADMTYSHGRPIPAGESIAATIESPRASAQVFYQFDDLFHDNAIFSPHPTFSPGTIMPLGDITGDGLANLADLPAFVAVLLANPVNLLHVSRADLNGDGQSDGEDIRPFVCQIIGG